MRKWVEKIARKVVKEALHDELDVVMVHKCLEDEFNFFLKEWDYKLGVAQAGITDCQNKINVLRRMIDPQYRAYEDNMKSFMSTPERDSDVYTTYGK